MEPAHLNSPRAEDAALAALLRSQSAEIPDDGFSARVLAALPAPAAHSTPRAGARWPWLAYLVGGGAGAAFAVSRASTWPNFLSGVEHLGRVSSAVLAALADPWLAVALTVTVLSIAVTLPFTQPRWRCW